MNKSTHAGAGAVNIVSRMFDSVESGEMDSFKSCFAEGAMIWLNISGVDNTVDDTSAHLVEMLKGFKSFRYTERESFQSGSSIFVKYAVVISPIEGKEIAIPTISHIRMSNEKITRVEEYFDSGALHSSDE